MLKEGENRIYVNCGRYVANLFKICNINDMKFEWDESKSSANKVKHGIDFEAAKAMWLDEDRIEVHAPHPIEKRSIIISTIQGKLWTAVYTVRSDKVRIISVRRSREKEAMLYEKENTGR